MGTAGRQQRSTRKTPSSKKKSTTILSEEDKAASLELKSQQHEIEALQITFYEIESWIEKTTPVLNRMTKELDKASVKFEERRCKQTNHDNNNNNHNNHYTLNNSTISLPPHPPSLPYSEITPTTSSSSTTTINTTNATASPFIHLPQSIPESQQHHDTSLLDPFNSLKWTMSFQPNSSLRLETNIKSVDQLVEAVQKIQLLTDPNHVNNNSHPHAHPQQDDFYQDESITITANGLVYQSSNTTSPSYFSSILNDNNNNSDDNAFSRMVDTSTEYWSNAIGRRPRICLEKYKHCNMNLSCLTKDLSPSMTEYICHLYWDCLHPKFSSDWASFWDRCNDPQLNQMCIDSGLAMVFLHGTRHHKDICANMSDIAFFYYDRARDSLMEFFDTPHCAILETLMNLSMFCILCKRHSQSRIYIGLGLRMMFDMGMHKRASLPQHDIKLRKKYLKFFTTLYYNDIQSALYSGEPPLLNDTECDIDFYEIIDLNKRIQELKLANYDDKMIEKETFYVHLMALAKIGKKTLQLVNEYQQQYPQPHRVQNDLPYRWAKRLQALEIELAQWYDKLPNYYRVNLQPKMPPSNFKQPSRSNFPTNECPPSSMNSNELRAQSALLLMLQYQTQWIILHKTFYNNATSKRCSPETTSSSVFTPTSPHPPTLFNIPPPISSSTNTTTTTTTNNNNNKDDDNDVSASIWNTNGTIYQWQRQCTDRSEAICIDAANRIVVITEEITEAYGWCVCQQFLSCIYQASTIYCRHIIAANNSNNNNSCLEAQKQHANAMLQRIVKTLAVSTIHYEGLPDDLTVCLKELLTEHGVLTSSSSPLSSLFSMAVNKNSNNGNDNSDNNNNNSAALNTLSHDSNDMHIDQVGHQQQQNEDEGEKVKTKYENMDYFTMDTSTPTSLPSSISSPLISSNLEPPSSSSSFETSNSLPSSLSSSSSLSATTATSTSTKLNQQQQHHHQTILDSPLLENTLFAFNDALPNSPDMFQRCLNQPRIQKTNNNTQYRSLLAGQSPTEAMLSIKLKDPVIDEAMAMEKSNESFSNWRQKFSSPYVAIGNQRII
ncbi:hypothetical protein BJ944DRAFT_271859 [Cunninghamella echinulata]|nr:hypothetical protein BJ944DRAFT_271859 [Cunninghamella echinulata]